MRTIRASEIGAYQYCRRAWWYQRQGIPSENQAELAGGQDLHARHGQRVVALGCARSLGYILLLAGIIALVVYFTLQAM